jgi:hypothetical protein
MPSVFRRPLGSTVLIEDVVRDQADALIDPTTVTITIWDSAGTKKVNAAAMTKDSTGHYSYIHQSASNDVAGFYKVQVKAVSGAYTSLKDDESAFELY